MHLYAKCFNICSLWASPFRHPHAISHITVLFCSFSFWITSCSAFLADYCHTISEQCGLSSIVCPVRAPFLMFYKFWCHLADTLRVLQWHIVLVSDLGWPCLSFFHSYLVLTIVRSFYFCSYLAPSSVQCTVAADYFMTWMMKVNAQGVCLALHRSWLEAEAVLS